MPYPSGDGQEGVETGSKESGTVSPLPGTSPTTELPNVPSVPPRPSNSSLVALDVWGSVPPPTIPLPFLLLVFPPNPPLLIPALQSSQLFPTLEM